MGGERDTDLTVLLAAADDADPSSRIDFRDAIAGHGVTAIPPLLRWIDEERHPHFAVRVIEAIGSRNPTEALVALRGVIHGEPTVIAYAAEAAARITPARGTSPRAVPASGRTGRLGLYFSAAAPDVSRVQLRERPGFTPEAIVEAINRARRARGEAVLDDREARQVMANLQRRAEQPDRYHSPCWNCSAEVDEATNEHCRGCGWLVCWCGACRKAAYVDAQGRSGTCRHQIWSLQPETIEDYDFNGVPILTARGPSPSADEVRGILSTAGVTAIYHWSPSRAVASVLRLGLLSRIELRRRGIPFVEHGQGTQEKASVLSSYVSVSFRPKFGMMHSWSETPIVWQLSPEVLTSSGVLFLSGNAASRATNLDDILASDSPTALQSGLEAYNGGGGQPEMLVPWRIPRVAIASVHVPDEGSRAETAAAVQDGHFARPPRVLVYDTGRLSAPT